uniref:Uncharacterized protein n=1 Tax=viral metagenome TaxID=1070528 RepID=A0A2V0RHX2_9ZZZZ
MKENPKPRSLLETALATMLHIVIKCHENVSYAPRVAALRTCEVTQDVKHVAAALVADVMRDDQPERWKISFAILPYPDGYDDSRMRLECMIWRDGDMGAFDPFAFIYSDDDSVNAKDEFMDLCLMRWCEYVDGVRFSDF